MAETGVWVGIATGPLMTGLAEEAGIGTEGYEWIYGTAPRKHPFEPHVDLDGTFFTAFEELVNPNDFPDSPFYYPGDHEPGCLCDYMPVLFDLPIDVSQGLIDVTAILLADLRAEAAVAESVLDSTPRRKRKPRKP